MFDTVLFDLDGTISDSGPGITRSVAYALEKFGITPPPLEELNHFVGPPLKDSFRDSYGFTPEQCEQAVVWYRERYRAKGVYETAPYPGMCELLRELHERGKTVALATSKPTVFARIVLSDYGVSDCFDLVLGCELDGRRGEKIEVMTECLELLGISGEKKQRAVMVGDRSYDINGAKHCGLRSVAVTYGYAPEGELEAADPDYTVKDAAGLRELLLSE
ncbi:MAG: HAD hydrolase-like protein [Candidatus Heteroscillospira sp.]|jgi:phosphoglycolate phosphatase